MERRSQLSSMSIRELKDILKAKNISFADCFEKQDLSTLLLSFFRTGVFYGHI